MKLLLKLIGMSCVLVAALWCLQRAAYGQHIPRFHRYAMTRLDDTTTLDMVKDAKEDKCHLIYRAVTLHGYTYSGKYGNTPDALAVAYLGEVPCDPIPVPPVVGSAPPASPVR